LRAVFLATSANTIYFNKPLLLCGPWQIKGTTTLFENKFLTLREDQVLKPDGQAGSYATVKMINSVAILPIGEHSQVHLVTQFRYAIGQESL
jgi:ADP-ribose pyrophosphatase